MKILLVEDDAVAAQMLKEHLEMNQYLVDYTADGEAAWELAQAFVYDLILLNVVLPKLNGITFCQKLRAKGDCTPILLLTAQNSTVLEIAGLDAGADDFLVKPYQLDELFARVRAVIRRGDATLMSGIQWGQLCLEPKNCHVTFDKQRLHLTPKEYALLQLFLTNKQGVLSENDLLDDLWLFEDAPSTKEKHLSQLVQKLPQELSQSPIHIRPRDNIYSSPKLAIANQEIHLLIIEGDGGIASALTSEAKIRGIQAHTVTTIAHAREILACLQPNIILLDLSFSNSLENGFELLGELSAVKSPIPVLVLTASESFSERVQATKLGDIGFLQKPVSPSEVIDAVTQLLQQSNTLRAKLLIVDDDSQILDFIQTLLSPWGFQLALLDDPREFWETLEQFDPDLLILDWEMPYFSGIDLCQVVRADLHWNELPIIFLSAHNDAQKVQQVFTCGADDYVSKPIVESELIARILNRLKRSKILHDLADVDILTSLSNRRKFIQDFNYLLRLANRQKQSLCFILLDLDHFKSINDSYGHDTGDKVLRQLAQLLKYYFRDEDIVARWGGEEFTIGLYGINRQQSIHRMTKFLNTFHQHEFSDTKERKFQVTFSAGLAEYPYDGNNLEELYHVADSLLYKAKVSGRNQVLSLQSN